MPETSVKGKFDFNSAYDRPEYPESVQASLDKYYSAYEAYIDAYKDSSRHDQVQLFDTMVGRATIFKNRARAELASEGKQIAIQICKEILSFQVNQGTMRQREVKIANLVAHLERRGIEAGFLIAKKRDFVVASNIPVN